MSLNNPRAPRQSRQAPPAAEGVVSADTILKVQQRLRELGFYVRDNIDGRWGPRTQTAVGNFQRSQGINPSGQLDPQTLSALGLSGEPATQTQ